MKFQVNRNEGPSKQKWRSKQTKMRLQAKKKEVNKNEVPGKQKLSSKQTNMWLKVNKNEGPSKKKRG